MSKKKDEMEETVVEKDEEIKKEAAIEELPGVGSATAEKLREAGFDNLMSIAVASVGELVNVPVFPFPLESLAVVPLPSSNLQ